jgi:hypothetical protein
LTGAFEKFLQPKARAVQARADRADRDVEGGRDRVVGEVGPEEEEEHLAVLAPERAERPGELLRGEIGIGDAVEAGEERIDARPGQRPQLAPLLPGASPGEVERDAEGPGPRVRIVGR